MGIIKPSVKKINYNNESRCYTYSIIPGVMF